MADNIDDFVPFIYRITLVQNLMGKEHGQLKTDKNRKVIHSAAFELKTFRSKVDDHKSFDHR